MVDEEIGQPPAQSGGLALPKTMAAHFAILIEHLGRHLPVHRLVMGGGSILAARWGHRASTDIDLFTSYSAMKDMLDDGGVRLQLALAGVPSRQPAQVLPSGLVFGDVQGTPFSLNDNLFVSDDRLPTESVCSTPVQAATVGEVFDGKILGRLLNHSLGAYRPPPVRDLYDIVIGAQKVPEVMQNALARWSEEDALAMAEYLHATADKWHQQDSKRLIDARWDVKLDGLPRRMAAAFRSRDVAAMPIAAIRERRDSDREQSEGA